MWEEETPEAKLFRANSRTINNAICLSSICVRQKTFDKYSPSVIFEGRLFHRMGSLLPEEGEKPRFAQVYILDPSQQSTQRIEIMNISTKLSPREVTKMKDLLELVQKVVQQHNPYVKDIMQVLEIPEDQLEKGKIIISAKAKPKNAHSRVYNEQVNLNELSIVLNEEAHEKHDFVINLRGGGQSIIHDLNPKAMPLHFTLLFLEGTHGWSTELKHANNPNKRVTAREWFCFHTHVRNTVSDYLFRAGRLFQEWILNAWITCETQNLKFLYHNQPLLRADSYQNVQDYVNARINQENCQDPAEQENSVGRLVKMPSSYIKSKDWYNKQLQNAIAICRYFHKPTLFLTMTCNPKWPEITDHLLPDQKAQDRPDIVA